MTVLEVRKIIDAQTTAGIHGLLIFTIITDFNLGM